MSQARAQRRTTDGLSWNKESWGSLQRIAQVTMVSASVITVCIARVQEARVWANRGQELGLATLVSPSFMTPFLLSHLQSALPLRNS